MEEDKSLGDRRPPFKPFETNSDRMQELIPFFALGEPEIAVVDDILAGLSEGEISSERERFSSRIQNFEGFGQEKYADLQYWICQKVGLCFNMGLQNSSGLDLLDIGTGGGHLLAVLKHLGHNPIGIDVRNDLYQALALLLRVDRRVQRVRPLSPLKTLGARFDLITIHWPGFDVSGEPRRPWGSEEWKFLWNDLAVNHLKPGGTLHVQLNRRGAGGDAEERVYSPEVLRLARLFGGVGDMRGGEIIFRETQPDRFAGGSILFKIRSRLSRYA
jgi:SAM-dependent methyltransferase